MEYDDSDRDMVYNHLKRFLDREGFSEGTTIWINPVNRFDNFIEEKELIFLEFIEKIIRSRLLKIKSDLKLYDFLSDTLLKEICLFEYIQFR